MFSKPTINELKEELRDLTTDLLIDLFIIDLLTRYPIDPAADNRLLRAAAFRTGCFLEQHSADVATIGKLLLERAKESTVSV